MKKATHAFQPSDFPESGKGTIGKLALALIAVFLLICSQPAAHAVEVTVNPQDVIDTSLTQDGNVDDELLIPSLNASFFTNGAFADFGEGTGKDSITITVGGGNFSAVEISPSGLFRNFEIVNLSEQNDFWTVTDNDELLEYIDGRTGDDTVVFGDGSHSAEEIHSEGLYRDFQRVRLSDSDNIWTVTDNDEALQFINAAGGNDSIAFGDGDHSAESINSSDGLYRNFERATLSDNDNVWTVTDNDQSLQYINALAGNDSVAFVDGSSHSAANISDTGRYRNFERVRLSDIDNVWTGTDNDEPLQYIDALGGTEDTVAFAGFGDGNYSAANISDTGRYRNFEQVTLSDNDNVWAVTENDEDLENINALEGTDTLENQITKEDEGPFSAADTDFRVGDFYSSTGEATHWSATGDARATRYSGFERAAVGINDEDNTWEASRDDRDPVRDWQWINARGGNDSLVLGDLEQSAANISSTGFYRNFEMVDLSENDNIWTVTDNDQPLQYINGLGGDDTVAFVNGSSHSAASINSSDGRYRNFERVRLSDIDNVWTVTDNDRQLQYIDALPGTDTVILGDGDHSAENIHAGGRYRGFEQANLSNNNNNVWTVSDNDENLESINALGGTDTLVNPVADRNGDGSFNVMDSSFSTGDLGNGSFANYSNFEQVAVVINEENNTWTASEEDSTKDWQWINASGGTDTVVLGDLEQSAANISSTGFYRNFERVDLSDNNNIWTVTNNDEDLEYIDALLGTDTISFGDGDHSAANIGDAERYRNFEQVTLSNGNNSWAISENDADLDRIDALGGTDTLEDQIEGDGPFSAEDSDFSVGDLGTGEFTKYSGFEQVAVGINDEDNTWEASEDDRAPDRGWKWINARGGTDTIVLGDGNHNAANISSTGFYRNFERVTLSINNNRWTVTENDENPELEYIDALLGTDTISFGDGNHSAANINSSDGCYRGFEVVELSDNDNIWTVTDNDRSPGLEYIDALGGNDSVAFGDGDHSAQDISEDGRYRNFERVTLSDNDNVWTVTENDEALQFINAAGGNDSVAFGDGDHSAENINSSGRYRNFERVTLSDNNNVWTVTENDEALQFINAAGGNEDTVAFGNGSHSAANINSSNGRYRNFERVTLSEEDDSWEITENDKDLDSIDALGGMDTLETILTDVNDDGSFNASDTSFSITDLNNPAKPEFGNYSNFEQVAVGINEGNNTWVAWVNDSTKGWQWINARGGTDTLALGNGSHNAANINSSGFYRNFEQVTLSNSTDIWTFTENDEELTVIDALRGIDTLVFGDGSHSAANISDTGRYRNFQRVHLSDSANMWTVTDNDRNLEYIDALDETDSILVNVGNGSAAAINADDFGEENLYRNFESLKKTGEGTLFVQKKINFGESGNVSVEEGTLSFDISIETQDGAGASAANSGRLVAGGIYTTANSSIAVNGLNVVSLSQSESREVSVFAGNTSGVNASTSFVDPGLFVELERRPDEIYVGFDTREDEIDADFETTNQRTLLKTIQTALKQGKIESDSSGIVNLLNNRRLNQAQVNGLIPGEHGGIDYEIIDIQRTLFGQIEEKVVEAVQLRPWETERDTHHFKIFAGGFEKTISGDLFKVGARGFSGGVHRLLFNEKMGVGIAAAASFLETRRERVNEKTEGFHGALYTKYKSGRISATGILSAGTHDYKSSRNSVFGEIRGETDILVYGGKVSAGIEILENLPVRIKPEASFMFAQSSTEPYTETGGLGISVKKTETESAEAGAKINIAFNPLTTALRTLVQPELEAGIYYDFLSGGNNARASVFNTDYTIFRSQVSDGTRYSTGVKLTMSDNKHLAFKIGYKVEFFNGMRSYLGSGQFFVRF